MIFIDTLCYIWLFLWLVDRYIVSTWITVLPLLTTKQSLDAFTYSDKNERLSIQLIIYLSYGTTNRITELVWIAQPFNHEMPNVPYQNQLVGWIQMKKSIVINVSALYELKIIPLPDDENSQFNSYFENIPGCLMTKYHSIISCYVNFKRLKWKESRQYFV